MTAREHRVKHGKPKQRAKHWHDRCVALAREHGLESPGVLDLFDHIADIREWNGEARAEAEFNAWNETVQIFERKAA